MVLLFAWGNVEYLKPKYMRLSDRETLQNLPEVIGLIVDTEDRVQKYVTSGDIATEKAGVLRTEQVAHLEEFYAKLRGGGRVFRVKIWNNDYQILWSDSVSVVGQRFPELSELNRLYTSGNREVAVQRKIIEGANEDEDAGEGTFDNYLELYIPIRDGDDGTVAGAVECYLGLEDVISATTRQLYVSGGISVGFSFLFLALLAFALTHKWEGSDHNRIFTQ